ncbi:tetratricopeptide repeat protein [Zoogloea sp.]|uniref:tetratricopeptide repeat protein n=1 Tax=Zoogloea sp. TaxID=49181 RepID=UPI001416203F|nr:MAG: tetratricopeptide repeat protein [Zoogloea sp.]
MTTANSLAAAFEHAVRLLENNQPDAARYVFRQILAVVPEHPDVLHLLGVCDLVEGKPEQAAGWIRQSLAGAPSDPVRHNNLAVALIRLGRFEEAVEATGQALALHADYADALNNRGSALAELGRNAEALEAYTRAAALVEDSADVHANKGHIHLRLGQPREALDSYLRALAIDARHAPALDNLSQSSHLATLSYFDPDSPYLAGCPVAPASLDDFRGACRLLNDGHIGRAASGFEALLQRHPDWIEARLLAAIVDYRRGEFALGLAHCDRLAAKDLPPSPQAILDDYRSRLSSALRLQALKGSVHSGPAPAPRQARDEVLHLVCDFPRRAGTELRCLDLAARLRAHVRVEVWATSPGIHESFVGQGIRLIDPAAGEVPDGGTLAVIGAWHPIGEWYGAARFRRVLVVYNVDQPNHLESAIRALALPGKPPVEIVYASDWMREQTGLPGRFEPSPVDLQRFRPQPGGFRPDRFVVGRLSRDLHYKFHVGAPAFFSALAARGVPVRMMGATVLADVLGAIPGIELMAVEAQPAEDFLRSLDCFVYRTHSYFPEPWGRVVTEAMATGLPVVAHAAGGFAQIIEHGRNGFLFHSDAEALSIIDALRASPGLRRSVGEAARASVEALYAGSSFDRYWQFYAD